MKCPQCKGLGYSEGYGCPGFRLMKITCDICKGSGDLPADMIYDPERGQAMKDERKEQRITLREWGKSHGINLVELSRMERGFFKS